MEEVERFERIQRQNESVSGTGTTNDYVIRDNETGVLYLQTTNRHGTSAVLLVDRLGNPLVDDKETE